MSRKSQLIAVLAVLLIAGTFQLVQASLDLFGIGFKNSYDYTLRQNIGGKWYEAAGPQGARQAQIVVNAWHQGSTTPYGQAPKYTAACYSLQGDSLADTPSVVPCDTTNEHLFAGIWSENVDTGLEGELIIEGRAEVYCTGSITPGDYLIVATEGGTVADSRTLRLLGDSQPIDATGRFGTGTTKTYASYCIAGDTSAAFTSGESQLLTVIVRGTRK